MRKLFIILLFINITGISMAQSIEKNSKADFSKKGFASMGLSYFLLSPKEQDNMHFVGITMGGGFYVTPQSRLGFELGIHGLASEKQEIGTFSYTSQTGSGPTTTHDDGKITRSYTSVPILGTWAYELNIGGKAYIYVGPTIGVNMLSGINRYDPIVTEGDPPKDRKTKAAFCYGGNLGLCVDVADMTSINLGYKCLGNTNVTLDYAEYKLIGHQICATILLTF